MPSTRTLRMSFAGGEVSPRMFGRVDDAKYQAGAATLRNFTIEPQGAALNRAGLKYVATTKDTDNVSGASFTKVSRLLPFKFSIDQQLVLEVGDFYIRFHVDGAPLLVEAVTPTNLTFTFQAPTVVTFTAAAPGVVNWPAHTLKNGEPVQFTTNGTFPVEITAGTTYYVRNQAAGTFNISLTPTGPLIDLSGAGLPTHTGRRYYSVADIVVFDDPGIAGGNRNYYCTSVNASQTPLANPPWYLMPLGDIYEIPTGYPAADVFGLRYDQSFDVLSLVTTGHFPRELRRLGATRWTWVPVALGANLPAPTGVTVTDWNGTKLGLTNITNAAVAVFTTALNHGLSAGVPVFLFDITTAVYVELSGKFFTVDTVPALTTFTLKSYSGGVQVSTAAAGAPLANQGTVAVAAPTQDVNNRYRVTAIDASQNESDPSAVIGATNNLFVSGSFNTISWDSVTGAVRYAVFKERDGLFGFIGQTEQDARPLTTSATWDGATDLFTWTGHQLISGEPIRFDTATPGHTLPAPIVAGTTYFVRVLNANDFFLTLEAAPESPVLLLAAGTGTARATRRYAFTDDSVAPDMGTTPPIRDPNELAQVANYPGAVAHFEQRRCFAGTLTDPQTFWATRSNTESDLSYTLPSKDDNRLKFKVATREQQQIRHIVPLGELLLLTDAVEWRVSAVNSEALTPDTISVRPQSYIGANHARPVVTNYAMLFAAARGGHLREMSFSFNVNQYVTGDLSLRAAHLFDTFEIVDLAYGKSPQSLVYAVSSSGKLLVLTYVPEEQVGAWTWWETDGAFESVCVITEGAEDVLYAIVRRTIGGVTKRFVERQSTRVFATLADAVFLDAFRTYSGGPTSAISGLSHLNGKVVKILADGKVHPPRTVVAGAITLDYDASKVHVGLGYVSDLKTLPATLQAEAFGLGRTKNVTQVQLRLVASAGLSSGLRIGSTETSLVPIDPYLAATATADGASDVRPNPDWTKDGQILVRQEDPLPVTIVGMTLEVAVGG